MKRAAAVLALLLTACTQSSAPPIGTASNARESPSTVVTASAAAVVAVSQLPLTTVGFSCRLPVEIAASDDGSLYTGGFVVFPAGTLVTDPAGSIRRPPSQADYTTDSSPTLHGLTGLMYDEAERRWVPTDPNLMTPDGRYYAYATGNYVNVVNVTDGSAKAFLVAISGVGTPNIAIADFSAAGVYILVNEGAAYPNGVWLMNPATGGVRVLATISGVMAVRDGYAWIGLVDPRDPSPPRLSSSELTFDSIARIDLATGTQTVWYYSPGASVSLLGLDDHGLPVVGLARNADMDFNQVSEVRLVQRPGDAGLLIFSGEWGLQSPQRDGARLWFGGGSGIYVYTAQRGLQNVFAGAGLPVGRCR